MKIYIAGKITGLPIDEYTKNFQAAEKRLSAEGHIVLTPICLPLGLEWKEYLTICFSMVRICDAIYLLKNWKESSGAIAEYEHAKAIGKMIVFEEEN